MRIPLMFLILILIGKHMKSYNAQDNFVFNGFLESAGGASVGTSSPVTLTNSEFFKVGHVFYSFPLSFKNSTNASVNSFSTTFIFKIGSRNPELAGHGIAFAVSPTKNIPYGSSAQYLGLFNRSNDGDPANHIVAIEFDVFENQVFSDINGNHVGIDINGLVSNISISAGYFSDDDGKFRAINLKSGDPILVWVEYNGTEKQLNVTLSPVNVPKPSRSLLSAALDLSPIILETMYVGFSSSTGRLTASQSILGWSFMMNGKAQPLDLSRLSNKIVRKKMNFLLVTLLPIAAFIFLAGIVVFVVRRKKRFEEVSEDWEVPYGPQRFAYKDLYVATKGFAAKELLGKGGFGQVFGGVLPRSKIQVAVKKVTHDSSQGMREFVAEIATIGKLQHRNIVRLLGYCRRKGELLLVYDFMPNGSLDKFLFDQSKPILKWTKRYKIIKDISLALFYLHQQWLQVVIHRDVKASNILLDGEMNAKLGDFGLAKLCAHGADPQTSRPAGTLGYIAPELARTGKASTHTDVFAFGAFLLEMACGRRPVEPRASPMDIMLVDLVTQCWRRGTILESVDPRLGDGYVVEEMELVLKLGLLCSQSVASARPSMSSVVQYLGGEARLPDGLNADCLALGFNEGYIEQAYAVCVLGFIFGFRLCHCFYRYYSTSIRSWSSCVTAGNKSTLSTWLILPEKVNNNININNFRKLPESQGTRCFGSPSGTVISTLTFALARRPGDKVRTAMDSPSQRLRERELTIQMLKACNLFRMASSWQTIRVSNIRYSEFPGVGNLTLHFPDNFGADTTQILYIGLKGEATQTPS
ncbi:hypothetical protein IFM89_022589 [Coptis chinensis]|uniref:non-specific serine/threonine protein kinase n=1 Tax=Coptis chinensis TaxID=261450 RepID=A0A835M3Q7_9MAGN|nr:hypothetical protein IFM89_022589 [Coptis chinensis]